MPVYNSDVVAIFEEIADLLDIEGANQFRVRAYRNAARTIETLSRPVADMLEEGKDLTELEGVGEDLAGKIEEIVKTGGLAQLDEVRARTPPALAEMLRLHGLGPKRVQKIHQELDVNSLEDLKTAAAEGEIRELEGLGPKTEEKILDELERAQDKDERTRLDVAEELAEPLVAFVKGIEGVERVEVAGSYRRRKETVGDLDILVTGEDGGRIIDRFVEFEDVEEVVSQGETRSTVLMRTGLQVDLRVVAEQSYGAALIYFTGSKPHNLHLRKMALDRDLKLNEYGVFRDEERIAGETETEMYDLFDLPFIVPELREDRGEIEAAKRGDLPELVTLDDLRGDLQTHTDASDGHNTLAEMAKAARERGHEYLAITDHSQYVGVTQGLDADELAARIDEIDELDAELDGIRLLKGIEVDILGDGSLALPDDVLRRLDVVIASVHSKFDLSRDEQTERIIRAMDHPNCHILAHPTGRLIGERLPYEIDLERVMEAALERGCFLEINAQPVRLDLDDVYAKMAKEMGLKLSISTDAHRVAELDYLRFGVGQARRGWLSPDDVLNTRPLSDLMSLLAR
jgi:DNA polymerase (family 10)